MTMNVGEKPLFFRKLEPWVVIGKYFNCEALESLDCSPRTHIPQVEKGEFRFS